MKQPVIKAPTINLEGKEYTARKRKMKQLRLYGKSLKEITPIIKPIFELKSITSANAMEVIGDILESLGEEDILNKCAEFIAVTINNKEVTAELILEQMDAEDLISTLIQCSIYIRTFVDMKLEQIPNA